MKKKLRSELLRLKEIGGVESLASELGAFIETIETSEHSIPISRKLLAEAAQAIRSNALDVAHDFIGTAIEAYTHERVGDEMQLPKEVTANLSGTVPSEGTLDGVPFPEMQETPPFEQASEDVVSGFANLLSVAGYVEEASKYLSGFNTLKATEGQGETGMKDLDTLKKMRAKFKAEANLNMVRTLDQVIADMEEDAAPIDETLEEPKVVEAPVADEPALVDAPPAPPADVAAPLPEGEEKPVLEIEPETEDEKKEKTAAEAAIMKGNVKQAKKHVRNARSMERARIIAALVKAGDFELASEGLSEAEADEVHTDDIKPEEKNAGMAPDQVEPKDEACDADAEEPKLPEEVAVEQPSPVAEEGDERKEAEEIAASARRMIKAKRMKGAVVALTKLDTLEKAVYEGVRVAEQECKDSALAAEGFQVWKGVRKTRLKTEMAIAAAEGDEEAKQEAMEAMEALEGEDSLEDTLESKPAESKELTEAPIVPMGGKPEVAPGTPPAPVAPVCEEGDEDCEETEETEENMEADAMKYEVLQSMESLQNMKVSSDDLAFTLWNSESNPYWAVQACGKPVAEVHLEDQTDSSAIAEFFCDEQKWPMVVAQTTSKVGLVEMLKGVNARFYANAMQKSKLAQTMKSQAVAEVKKASAEKLTTIRSSLTDAVLVAAEQLNKGLIPGKPNALKRAFADRLMSLGIHNPALIVEDCFAEGFSGFMGQVMADANDLIEMPKEAFAHTRKMVAAAINVSQQTVNNHSQETMSQRLSRTSMPLASTSPTMEAPVVQEAIAAESQKFSSREQRQNLRSKLKLSSKF